MLCFSIFFLGYSFTRILVQILCQTSEVYHAMIKVFIILFEFMDIITTVLTINYKEKQRPNNYMWSNYDIILA